MITTEVCNYCKSTRQKDVVELPQMLNLFSICQYITILLEEEQGSHDLGAGYNLWLPIHAPFQVCDFLNFFFHVIVRQN